ncbi:Aste57867_15839 [Aphanomyces stellatus]|uniref:Aste57867_15839 protein n=1 Tax=Aphanomyces stellatus TaxID=120398 RepID=A0A485L418_9STRA|nr:hypothetical protein As57867_015783 [Aphanomyces stellatus]VFT92626.1 Aste57867_15839 [Aphanomyces stellatus]
MPRSVHVAPHATTPPTRARRRGRVMGLLGFVYALGTTLLSTAYLVLLGPSLANDHWWPHFTVPGLQTFLGDLYNGKVALGVSDGTSLDLFDPSSVVVKTYDNTATMSMRPGAARAILLDAMPLADAIRLMRARSLADNLRTTAPSCWLDLNRTYDMAHSAARQAKCNAQWTANAALYLETLFRNVHPSELRTSTYVAAMETGLFAYVAASGGAAWVQALLVASRDDDAWRVSVADEVALWRTHGLVVFQNRMQNLYQEGFRDAIVVTNAFGMRQRITISFLPDVTRPHAAWSSAYATCGLGMDLDSATQAGGASLIRAAPNYFELVAGMTWDDWNCGAVATTPATAIIRSFLGPLANFDVTLVRAPASLQHLVAAFQTALVTTLLQDETSRTMYLALSELRVRATPRAWTAHDEAIVYYGGNPLCPTGDPMPFVQPSFGYDDDCGVQVPHEIQLPRDALLMAFLARPDQDITSVCALCRPDEDVCHGALGAAHDVFRQKKLAQNDSIQWGALVDQVVADVAALDLTYLQWATVNATIDVVLAQPMVESPSESTDPWFFLGWLTLYDWAVGQREVYTFVGDVATVTLMSRRHDLVPLAAFAVELPQIASLYMWVVCFYVTAVLGLVLTVTTVFACHFRQSDTQLHLFRCNRVIGSVWIGRPFLALRGATAILVLSTSSTQFLSVGLSRLVFVPRPLAHTCVLAGEALWLEYVITDIFAPLTHPDTHLYARVSSVLAWVAIVVLETFDPVVARATFTHDCTLISFTAGVDCTSGHLEIGSYARVQLLIAVLVASVAAAFSVCRMCRWTCQMQPLLHPASSSVVFASASNAFLEWSRSSTTVDSVGCIVSGLVPIGSRYLFDVKLWVLLPATMHASIDHDGGVDQHKTAPPGHFNINHPPAFEKPRQQPQQPRHILVVPHHVATSNDTCRPGRWRFNITRWSGIFALAYMGGLVASSYLFLLFSDTIFVNDFVWAGFDETNTHSFLANLVNTNLQLTTWSQLTLDDPALGALVTSTNDTNIYSSAIYANAIQDEANTLLNVVLGLRAMDACMLPWIATAYCFVDFDKRWDMAYSAQRQARCVADQVHNGAVYLEAHLRNAKSWPELMACWGEGLTTGLFASLDTTKAGHMWLNVVQTSHFTPVHETKLWQAHGITSYTTQWQNFKQLGVVESFLVANAVGVSYPLTLKNTSSRFHVSAGSSRVMSWAFANDLMFVVAQNASLLPGSPSYAYINTTIDATLTRAYVLSSPLDPALAAFAVTVGPFGVVDLKRIAPPPDVLDLVRTAHRFLMASLAAVDNIQASIWPLEALHSWLPQPEAWDPPLVLWGGDVTCGLNIGASLIPYQFFSADGLCGTYLYDAFTPSTFNVLLAMLFVPGLITSTAITWTVVAARDQTHQRAIVDRLNASTTFWQSFPSDGWMQFSTDAAHVQATIRDIINLSIVQYVTVDEGSSSSLNALTLSHINVFAPSERAFELFAWLYVLDWVDGRREVVSFQGDHQSLTTISAAIDLDTRPRNAQEIPRNVSTYILRVLDFVTLVLFGVGCLVCGYIATSDGFVAGLHVVPFNLVAGHVWIGRPLMLVRGLAAVCILSTATLTLVQPGVVAYFTAPVHDPLSTLLSASELSWLVYVVVDTLSIVTRQYTSKYSTLSAVVVTLVAAAWCAVSPTTHTATLDRRCTVVAVDFDVVCTSAIVAIGDVTRFGRFIALACGATCVCYFVERFRPHNYAPRSHRQLVSYMLYAAAKHEFERDIRQHWHHDGVFYIDKASAVLSGLLTVEIRQAMHIFDVKTWRLYTITAANMQARGAHLPPRLAHAVPLFE